MAAKKVSGSKKSARKKQGNLKDLSGPGQELSEWQAKAVKGGAEVKLFQAFTSHQHVKND